MTYSEKLKDPRWQRRRLEVLERCKWKCVSCESAGKTLHVHHRWYVSGREPWEYPAICLVALCDECHENQREEAAIENGTEWELLLAHLFDPNDLYWDGASISIEASRRLEQGVSKYDLREALYRTLKDDALFSAALLALEQRRAQFDADFKELTGDDSNTAF